MSISAAASTELSSFLVSLLSRILIFFAWFGASILFARWVVLPLVEEVEVKKQTALLIQALQENDTNRAKAFLFDGESARLQRQIVELNRRLAESSDPEEIKKLREMLPWHGYRCRIPVRGGNSSESCRAGDPMCGL